VDENEAYAGEGPKNEVVGDAKAWVRRRDIYFTPRD